MVGARASRVLGCGRLGPVGLALGLAVSWRGRRGGRALTAEAERVGDLVVDVNIHRGVRREHVDGAVVHLLTPLAVVLQHLLQRHAVGNVELLDEQPLVGANGLYLPSGATRLDELGSPVVQGLVELLDGRVLDLAALLVEGAEDGGELLCGAVLGPDWCGDEGVGENPCRIGPGCVCGASVLLRGYRGVLLVGIAVDWQCGEAIDECSNVALGRRRGTIEDSHTVWRRRIDQRREVRGSRWRWDRDEG